MNENATVYHDIGHLQEMLLLGQGATCIQAGNLASDIRSDIKDAQAGVTHDLHRNTADLLAASARSDAANRDSDVAAADRLATTSRDINERVERGIYATHDTHARELVVLGDIQYRQLLGVKDTVEQIAASERRTQLELSNLRESNAKQHCKIKMLVLQEGSKTREQAADYRMRDLEARLAIAQNEILIKP